MRDLKQLLGPMRVPFLVLPPVCVFLGMSSAIWTEGKIDVFHLVFAFVGALAAHISVNALNEYFDFRSGLDFRTRRTPFSGGSGTLPAQPKLARSALSTGVVSAGITVVVGIYFLAVWGPAILPLGVLGLVVIVAYTPWLTRSPLACLLAPGVGFGLLMVMGTDFCLTGSYSWTAFFASLVPTFLVSNLLLLNQFPDAEADATVGRRHYPIVAGKRTSAIIYVAFLGGAFLSVIVGVIVNSLPAWALLGLLALGLAVPISLNVLRHAEDLEKLMPAMGMNVLLNIVMPVLVGVGLLLGR
jgi:1,4-dihydroxy-2-naphthoate octaprenyltransferase